MRTELTTSTPIGFHITMRLEDSRSFAATPEARRVIARVVYAQGEMRGLLAFGAADNHLHAELATHRACAGAFAQYVEVALRVRLSLVVRFEAARIRPLQDQHHAISTFHYIHRQQARHALDQDPTFDGTSLPDLLGLRVIDTAIASRVRTVLPRIGRAQLLEGLPAPMRAALDDSTTPVAIEVIADAAAAAFALPDLRGRSTDLARARHAAVHAASPDASNNQLAECLGIGAAGVRKLRQLPPEPLAVRAVRGQALLRMEWLRSRADATEGLSELGRVER